MHDSSCAPSTPTSRKGKSSKIRYPGDISTPHFATPRSAKKSVILLKRVIAKQRSEIDTLRRKVCRRDVQVRNLHHAVDLSKKQNSLSESDAEQLMVRMKYRGFS